MILNNKKRCKICIKTNTKLFLKGSRCFTVKCSFEKWKLKNKNKNFFLTKKKNFAIQKNDIRKIKNVFCITENFLSKIIKEHKENFINKLEYKIDRFLYKIKIFDSIFQSRQNIIFNRNIFIYKNKKYVRCKFCSLFIKDNDRIKIIANHDILKSRLLNNKVPGINIKQYNKNIFFITFIKKEYKIDSFINNFKINIKLLMRYYN